MTNGLHISRRKVLAGLGMIGIASAGAGLGTTAYFRDEESVAAELEAGRLDLKMDYRATYNAWLPLAETDAIVDGPVVADPDVEMGTVVGQAPDIRNSDGEALTGEQWAEFTRSADACDVESVADLEVEGQRVTDAITDVAYEFRSDADDDYLGPEGQVYADGETGLMFDLDDVKPKDEGEATLSLHTCGNPAYLWLKATLEENGENVVYEPESAFDAETDGEMGELANYLYTRVWDDVNCNNRPDGGAADVAVVFDHSCSMEWLNPFAGCRESENTAVPGKLESAQFGAKDLYQTLLDNGADAQAAFVPYASQAALAHDLAPVTGANQAAYDGAVDTDYNSGPNDLGSSTAIADGIKAAKNVLLGNGDEPTENGIDGTGNSARADAEKVMVILSDGFPNDPNVTTDNDNDGDPGENNDDGAFAAIEAAERARAEGITVYTVTYEVESFPIPELRDLMGTGFDTPAPGPFGFDTPDGRGFADSSSTALVASVAESALGTPSSTEIVDAFEEIAVSIAGGDDFLYQGSLAGLVDLAGSGIPLRTAATDGGDEEGPQCFDPGVYCYAFDWYFVCEPEDFDLPSDASEGTLADELTAAGLPLDPNIAQSDSVRFRFDVAATQCRHNMDNANPFGEHEPDDEEPIETAT